MKDIVRENFVLNGAPHHGSSLVEAMVACLEKSFKDLERRGIFCMSTVVSIFKSQ